MTKFSLNDAFKMFQVLKHTILNPQGALQLIAFKSILSFLFKFNGLGRGLKDYLNSEPIK